MAGGLTRGSVWTVRLGRTGGRERSGCRYAIVVQNDELCLLSTVAVALIPLLGYISGIIEQTEYLYSGMF